MDELEEEEIGQLTIAVKRPAKPIARKMTTMATSQMAMPATSKPKVAPLRV